MSISMKRHQGGHPSVCHTLSLCPCDSPLLVGLGSLTRVWLCPPFARHLALPCSFQSHRRFCLL